MVLLTIPVATIPKFPNQLNVVFKELAISSLDLSMPRGWQILGISCLCSSALARADQFKIEEIDLLKLERLFQQYN
jgi:hypothetical protein